MLFRTRHIILSHMGKMTTDPFLEGHDLINANSSSHGAYVALWVSVLMLGVNWPIMKLGLSHVSPFWMVSLRFLLSTPVVALLILVQKRRLPILNLSDLRVIGGVALLQFILQTGLVTLSLQWVPASTATILIYTTPFWLVVLDCLIFRAHVALHRFLITGVSALGCAVILFGSRHTGPLAPLFLILLASVFWALSMRLIATHTWVGDVRDAIFWQFLIAGLVMFPVAWGLEGAPTASAFSEPGVYYMVFIGPAATGLGFGLMVVAGRSLAVTRVSLISTAAPLIGFLSSAVLLGEQIGAMVLIGGVAILVALIAGSLTADRSDA